MALELDLDTFDKTISSGVALVDFWAPWCGPCQKMTPVIEDLSHENRVAAIAKVDVDKFGELAARFGIMSIPAIIVFKDGKPFRSFVGVTSKDVLQRAISDALGIA